MPLQHRHMSATLEIGDLYAWGVDPTWPGSTTDVSCRATELEVDMSAPALEVQVGCGRYTFPDAKRGDCRIGTILLPAGFFWDPSGSDTDPVGYNIRIIAKPLSTLSTGRTFMGWCKEWKWSSRGGQMQAENVVIDLNPKWAS